MSHQSIERVSPVAAPARVGQGTAVEQSRAAAEVLAAVQVAQQCPRNTTSAIAEMREVCRNETLAKRAFFAYPKGKSTVSGPSVFLARELARIWGHVHHGLIEMRRDDVYGESEMQAFAWDVQNNNRVSTTFIVPHKRDGKKNEAAEQLTQLRDIYENNANNGARRVRQAIFSVLPGWFVDEAVDLCQQTLSRGGGKPLPQRIADGVKAFEQFRVSPRQLEDRFGRPTAEWTEHDVAELGILYQSLNKREITVDEAFPRRVDEADLYGQPEDDGTPEPPAAETSGTWPAAREPGSGATS
ncbi:hypothetical protein ACWCV2_15315 [Streptomyces pseudogriseolus]